MALMVYLSLGPVFFNWEPQRWRDFYFRVADEAPIDLVYLGEVVCAKRMPFIAPHLAAVVERLQRAGKRIALSSLALIGNEREAALMRDLCTAEGLIVEANDIGLLPMLVGRPYILGPFVNAYNESALAYFAARGAERACLPPELSAISIATLAARASIPLEILAFGRLPLAISARCFHARAHQLHKDGCQFVCARDPDGLVVHTLEGEPFLAVNGLQTLSHTCLSLAGELQELERRGVAGFRLSPLPIDMVEVARLFRDALDRRIGPAEATKRLGELVPVMPLANGFLHGAEGRSRHRADLLGLD
jgi:O2-independent ubiquinone biosynthesis protein UbiV